MQQCILLAFSALVAGSPRWRSPLTETRACRGRPSRMLAPAWQQPGTSRVRGRIRVRSFVSEEQEVVVGVLQVLDREHGQI